MKQRRSIETHEYLVRAIAVLFDEIELETSEEIEASLRDAGYDPDEIGTRMKAAAEQALVSSPLNWRSRAQQELEEERARLAGFKSRSSKSRGETIRHQPLANRFYWRRFERS